MRNCEKIYVPKLFHDFENVKCEVRTQGVAFELIGRTSFNYSQSTVC